MDAKVGVYWQFRMGSFCHGRVRLAIDGGNADLVPGGGDSFFFNSGWVILICSLLVQAR